MKQIKFVALLLAPLALACGGGTPPPAAPEAANTSAAPEAAKPSAAAGPAVVGTVIGAPFRGAYGIIVQKGVTEDSGTLEFLVTEKPIECSALKDQKSQDAAVIATGGRAFFGYSTKLKKGAVTGPFAPDADATVFYLQKKADVSKPSGVSNTSSGFEGTISLKVDGDKITATVHAASEEGTPSPFAGDVVLKKCPAFP